MKYAIAVIDIGMTNKKVAVYDDRLNQIDAQYKNFSPQLIDGLECHGLEAMEDWFLEKLADGAKRFPIKVIAVTTHGATFVCTDTAGNVSLPSIFYTHEPGDAFHDEFYREFGSPEELQKATCTPYLKAMINMAKGIYFAKKRYPEAFAKTAYLFNYPQYWGFRLTGIYGMEGTYMGCHSYLWDWEKQRLSTAAEKLGLVPLMPGRLHNSWDILGTITPELAERTGLPGETIVTMGIHDSNASLLPHFAKKGETGFVLNSTGTWCVLMNPVKDHGFSPDEIGKVVFFNISAFGGPVKTAIFLGGQEFESWSRLIMGIHKRDDIPPFNKDLYITILKERRAFLMPELTAGSGQFPNSKPRVLEDGKEYHFAGMSAGSTGTALPPVFGDYERAFALLKISLVMQTLTALERSGLAPGNEVYTEGGFRRDRAYNALLSAALPDNRLFLTGIAEASAFGAAMTGRMALTGDSLTDLAADFTVDYTEVPKEGIPAIHSYREQWLQYTF
ncbi:carbohydrate kinase [Treponema sp. OttesenSCG-928-L16]|nr:carbohydrate kinase [Treponema sp. OttesenSCG-928-L16]